MTKEIVTVPNWNVRSIWLYGSVVQNDFRLGWSGMDILVLAGKQITDNQARELVQMRQFLAGIRIFLNEEPLKKAIEIRKEPMAYKDRKDIQQWLIGLGSVVQQYADVPEFELSAI